MRNNYIVILVSDEDPEHKVAHCWKINPDTGKVEEKFKSTQFTPVEFE